jgi:hypothetical protein
LEAWTEPDVEYWFVWLGGIRENCRVSIGPRFRIGIERTREVNCARARGGEVAVGTKKGLECCSFYLSLFLCVKFISVLFAVVTYIVYFANTLSLSSLSGKRNKTKAHRLPPRTLDKFANMKFSTTFLSTAVLLSSTISAYVHLEPPTN